jgi:hypothetical protein
MALDSALHHEDAVPQDPDPEGSSQPVIAAEWALWGKEAHETGAHVLRCSSGPLRAKDFAEIITRYSPGDLDVLPQYTISWIPDARREPEYVALGIHEFAPADPARSDGRIRRDAAGRAIVFVRLFCVRYADLAEVSASYQDLFQAAGQVPLPRDGAGRVALTLPAKQAPILRGPARLLAERVALLLLTGRPVCVVGADDVSVAQRLGFIDTAMAWLPYGLRATMSAGTWADSASQDLKLRLFFAGVPRSPGLLTDGRAPSEDRIVEWGHHENIGVPDGPAQLYHGWLKEVKGQAPMMLAEVIDPERFSPSSLLRLVGNLPTDKGIAETLDDLAQSLLVADKNAIRKAVKRLERYVAGELEIEPADLTQYRNRIRGGHLLADDDRLSAQLKGSLYDALIRLAFYPLTYLSYCAVEDCVGGEPRSLLRAALERCDRADILAWILVHRAPRSDKWLVTLHDEDDIPPAAPLGHLVHALAARTLRAEQHGHVVLDFALRYLGRYTANPGAVLAHYGFLVMEHEHIFADQETRVRWLMRVLDMSFTRPLSRPDIDEIFGQLDYQPTAALVEAVTRMTDHRGRHRKYIRQSVTAANLRSQGFPPHMIPAGSKWSGWLRRLPPSRWLRRLPPSRWRRGRGRGRLSATEPQPQQPQAVTSDEPGTVAALLPFREAQAAGPRNRVLSRESVWAHPRFTLAAALLFLAVGFVFLFYLVRHG